MSQGYVVVIERAQDNYAAYVPDLPGCVATGATQREVEDRIRSAIALHVEETVEKAAVVMHDRRVGGLPVVDDANKVVGIITESDIFRVFIDITRVRDGGIQMGFKLTREPGALKPILQDITNAGASILSIMTVYPQGQEHRNAYIRIAEMEKSELNKLRDQLSGAYELMFWLRDNVHPVVQ